MIRKFLAIFGALGVAACGQEVFEAPGIAQPPPASMVVRAESVVAVVPVDGSVEARQRATLSTRMTAQVNAVLVDLGSRVRRGQLLIRLGTDDIAAKRQTAKAAVAVARAARDEAARHAIRMDTLYAQDAVARVQRDAAHLSLTRAASQLVMAEAALQEVETASRYAAIRAPFDGAVVTRHVDEGDLAVPGMPLLVIESDGLRDAVLAVPADIASGLYAGTTMRVTTLNGLTTNAVVRVVAAGADAQSRTVEIRATVPADWPTGIHVTGLVPAGVREGVVIPESAVVRRGQLAGVRVLTPAGEVLRWVRLGRRAAAVGTEETLGEPLVEVLSGLEPGERIAL